ncbi:flavin reductase family protein [Psychrosphaera algicola]
MELKLSDYAPAQIYHLMTQTIIPRPIAWVLTENMALNKEERNYNLAPFSYFSAVSSNPPLLMISVGLKEGNTDKDTTVNCQSGSKAVVHIAADNQYQQVTQSAATLAYGESELDTADKEMQKLNDQLVAFDGFPLPRLQHCPVAFGCSVFEIQK